MKLIIAEKPDVVKAILQALPGSMSGDLKEGYCKKGDYTITNVFGHLMKLKDPEDYDAKYAKWNLADLPINFADWGIKPSEEPYKKKRFLLIKKLLADADTVIHAGDPDDEGQLLIDEILDYCNFKGKVLRLNTNDTSIAALQNAFASLRDNEDFILQGKAAYARSVADKCFGVNMSRFYSISNQKKLSVGRVQTPTLKLVVQRDLEIANHVKHFYYTIAGNLTGTDILLKFIPNKDFPGLSEDNQILDPSLLNELAEKLKTLELDFELTRKTKLEQPPLPFNLAELQILCNKKFKYSPTEVMQITQDLRAKQAITYNRSDCRYLSTEMYLEAPAVIEKALKNMHYEFSGYDIDEKRKSACFNDEEVNHHAHTAIIPTAQIVNLNDLTDAEFNVYEMICQYYLIQFMPPAEKETVTLTAALPEGKLMASASQYLTEGYRTLLSLKEEKKENMSLLTLSEDYIKLSSCLDNVQILESETKPPTHYTQGSLIKDMTCISKYVSDPEIKELLLQKDKEKKEENGSIGTPATRDSIINTLIERGFLKEEKNKLISTPLAHEFIKILPDEITSPALTALWWVYQEDIKNGTKMPRDLQESVVNSIQRYLQRPAPIINTDTLQSAESIGSCPWCKNPVLEKKAGFFCSERSCNFVLWKKLPGEKTLTITQAKALLSKGTTGKISGFKKKNGTGTFSAKLKLDTVTGKIELEF